MKRTLKNRNCDADYIAVLARQLLQHNTVAGRFTQALQLVSHPITYTRTSETFTQYKYVFYVSGYYPAYRFYLKHRLLIFQNTTFRRLD
jgi:hypothetical protein